MLRRTFLQFLGIAPAAAAVAKCLPGKEAFATPEAMPPTPAPPPPPQVHYEHWRYQDRTLGEWMTLSAADAFAYTACPRALDQSRWPNEGELRRAWGGVSVSYYDED